MPLVTVVLEGPYNNERTLVSIETDDGKPPQSFEQPKGTQWLHKTEDQIGRWVYRVD